MTKWKEKAHHIYRGKSCDKDWSAEKAVWRRLEGDPKESFKVNVNRSMLICSENRCARASKAFVDQRHHFRLFFVCPSPCPCPSLSLSLIRLDSTGPAGSDELFIISSTFLAEHSSSETHFNLLIILTIVPTPTTTTPLLPLATITIISSSTTSNGSMTTATRT
jgi:hypothetical protein